MSRLHSHRIVYLIGQLGAGGAERQLLYLLQAMDRRLYRPAVVAWNYEPRDVYVAKVRALNIPLYSAGQRSTLQKLWTLRRLLRDVTPEVVHSYSFFTNIAAAVATAGTAAVPIGSVRGDYLEDLRASGAVRGPVNARWPSFHIYNSAAALENACQSRRMLRPRRAMVVRNAIDIRRFSAAPDVTNDRPVILGIGSLLPSKRWDRLVSAAAELKKRGCAFRIDIAGDGPMKASLQNLSRHLGVEDSVRFLGYVDDIERRLQTSSWVAHPSDSEGCPNAVMEAMACGRAVVAMKCGDIPILIDDGKTGFIADPADERTFTIRLEQLLRHPNLRREMGHAGRLKAEREFGMDRLVAQTLEAYRLAGWRIGADEIVAHDSEAGTVRRGLSAS